MTDSAQDTLAMIARCMKHNAPQSTVLDAAYHSVPHPEVECARISEHQAGLGPNLLVWTGNSHKLALSIRP